ncbi:histidine phosphatase family protein [Pseudomonas sp. PB120]|uniref:lipopolysaccharide core heptose(II)-phosphate phosphatase PmrG n=1 Tax=Pseudomonas sp. PB120 TaxID=2494700 RepID=UPI0012FE2385|nr:histidine phosphatase family protein [Pseudomonas sp. PB120]MVV49880.1 histidine phosphatase family protein [Pseudomonas sp. PB120]
MNSRLTKLAFILVALAIVVVVTGFALWPKSPANLAHSSARETAELMRRWQAGDIVVLVRHAERCDQSSNPCLGPLDGITRVGSDSAVALGQRFTQLGMAQTDVFSSPLTRTAQTSHDMFGHDAVAQDWLASCGSGLRNDVVAHKRAHHNLLLVTHSGCIRDFEAATGFAHAAKSKYVSSLFISVDATGELQVLGIANAEGWPALLSKQ